MRIHSQSQGSIRFDWIGIRIPILTRWICMQIYVSSNSGWHSPLSRPHHPLLYYRKWLQSNTLHHHHHRPRRLLLKFCMNDYPGTCKLNIEKYPPSELLLSMLPYPFYWFIYWTWTELGICCRWKFILLICRIWCGCRSLPEKSSPIIYLPSFRRTFCVCDVCGWIYVPLTDIVRGIFAMQILFISPQ